MVFTLSTDNGVPPVISTSGDIEAAYTGVSYDVTPRISAGTWPILWSITGSNMPSGFGLSIDKNLGSVTFKPTSEGTYHLTLKAENSAGEAASECTVTVKPSLAPVINDKTLKHGVVGITYGLTTSRDILRYLLGSETDELISADGALPISFDVRGLPKGMSFDKETSYSESNQSGITSVKIYGTPEESGSFDIIITAKNAFGSTSRDFVLYVADNIPPVFSAAAPDSNYKMQAGIPYQPTGLLTLIAAIFLPAKKPLNFYVEGILPEGITYSRDVDGVISFSGIPAKTGTYNVILHASNELGADSHDVTFTVTGPAVIATNLLPEAVKGESYDFTLSMFDGAVCSWSVDAGLSDDMYLPAGLTLSESGRISGIPTESGKFTVSITAALKDSAALNESVSDTKTYALIVRELPEVTTSSLPDGKMNTPYSRVPLSADGTAPITWSIADGNLPAGLTLTQNGCILGTPTESGTFSLTLRVSNGAGYDEKTYTLSIASDGSQLQSPDVIPDSPDISPDVKPEIVTGNPRGISSITLGEAAAIAEEGGIIAAVLPEIRVDTSDSYSYMDADVFANVKISNDVPVGYILKWHPFIRTAAGESTEDSEKDSAVFYDSEGNIITAVPANRIVNVSSWLEAGKTYMPVISAVRNTQAANVGSSGGGCDTGAAGLAVLAAVICLRKRER